MDFESSVPEPDNYRKVFDYNTEFTNKSDKTKMELHLDQQSPDFLYIGCSDSRVPPNLFTGMEIGEMFVHRNIANIVSRYDHNIMSAIQYSVETLKVKHIAICGHYGCGGVKASMEDNLVGDLGKWVRAIKTVQNINYKELNAITDEEERLNRLVELNIFEQANNVFKISYVQKSIKAFGFPSVHGWVYNMQTGKLIDLKLEFK